MTRLAEPVSLFKGEYEIKVFDADNNLLGIQNVDVNNAETCINMGFDEFENMDFVQNSIVTVVSADVAQTTCQKWSRSFWKNPILPWSQSSS
jgi:hypothetical protein